MVFRADFDFDENGKVNDIINFISTSTVGAVVENPQLDIDGNVSIDDIDLNDYTVSVITKYNWGTDDGFFGSGESYEHIFTEPDDHKVNLTIWSETFTASGEPFRFKITTEKDVRVFSKFYNFITDRIPTWELIKNNAYEDLIFSMANFYDKLHRDTKDLYSFYDIDKMDPSLFEYWSNTFAQKSFYSKKVGGDISQKEFDDYDIFELIKEGIATPQQIKSFRQFLLFTSEAFKKKGTPEDIKKILKLFAADGNVLELWTENWGQTTEDPINESFILLDEFIDNKLDLNWLNINYIGSSNEFGHINSGFNSFTIDTYHKVDKVEYDADVVTEITSGALSGWVEFGINASPYSLLDIRKETGESIVDNSLYDEKDYYNIIETPEDRDDVLQPYLIQIDPTVLELGKRISITRKEAESEETLSLVSTKDKQWKNFESDITFRFIPLDEIERFNNERLPENEINVSFRGIDDETDTLDPFLSFNRYYRVVLNGSRNVVSLERVVESNSGEPIYQKLNLGNNENKIFDKSILIETGDNEYDVYEIQEDKIYRIRISVNGSYVSAYLREEDVYQSIIDNVNSDKGGNVWGEKSTKNEITLFENISIDKREFDILTVNENGEEVASVKYSPIQEKGNWGFGCKNSHVEVYEINLDPMDFVDILYTTEEKELSVKPKWLEIADDLELKYNNYGNNDQSFSKNIESPFTNKTTYEFSSPSEARSLQFLYFDNAPLDERISSRYTVTFDQNWVESNFENEEELMSKIIVPFSSQKSWFMPESRVWNKKFYKNALGGTDVEDPSGNGIIGFFNYNLTDTLGEYKTEPMDEFSSLQRDDSIFVFNEKTIQYGISNFDFGFRGLWEEVSPLSTYFPEIRGSRQTLTGSEFSNDVFLPITYNTGNEKRVIGVRFKNCDDIQKVIDRNSVDGNDEVQMWGLFTFQLHDDSVKYRPDGEWELTDSPNTKCHKIVKAYIPLGILSTFVQNYSLPTEYMHTVFNSGSTYISLDGVYTLLPRTKVEWQQGNIFARVLEPNEWEDTEEGLYSRYFLAAQLNLSTDLNDYQVVDEGVSNRYMINYDLRQLLGILDKRNNYQFNEGDTEEDKNKKVWDTLSWWLPDQLWRKRDFELLSLEDSDIATGVNYAGENSRYFYGEDLSKLSKIPSGLKIKILDGSINPRKTYYAKISMRLNWSGYKDGELSRNSSNDFRVKSKPLSKSEENNLKVVGGFRDNYGDSREVLVGECVSFLIPITWYDESQSSRDYLEWGNYLKGITTSNKKDPTITLTPYGLMTWLMNHSGESNFSEEITEEDLKGFLQVTSGWTIQDWNDRFKDLVRIDFVCEKIEKENYELFSEYGFLTQYAPEPGSYIEVTKNSSVNTDWKVMDSFIMVPQIRNSYYFTIAQDIKDLQQWVGRVEDIRANSFVIKENFYIFTNPSTIQLNDSVLFDVMTGGEFKGRYFFDVFFNENKYETLVDDFTLNRNINWLVWESDSDNVITFAKRKGSETLACSGIDNVYDIINVEGNRSLKKNLDKTISSFDPKKSGSGDYKNNFIGPDENGGYSKTAFVVDSKNQIFDISCDVYFDTSLKDKNFNSRRFDIILKCNTVYSPKRQQYVVDQYYFVGLGLFGFDVGLGVAKYNQDTDKMEVSFLSAFGDYGAKEIKVNTNYKLRAQVEENYIRVYFNEKLEKDRLVINYNISPDKQQSINKYVSGDFEELIYNVIGLQNLDITYPVDLESNIPDPRNEEYIFSDDLVKNTRPSGPYSGFCLYNDMTYVGEVVYKSKIQGLYKYNRANDSTNLSTIFSEINSKYNPGGPIDFVNRTIGGTVIVKMGQELFYKIKGKGVCKYNNKVSSVWVWGKNIFIEYFTNDLKGVEVVDERFMFYKPVYIKDNAFNIDHIHKYLQYTDRDIDSVYFSEGNLHVIMDDIQ